MFIKNSRQWSQKSLGVACRNSVALVALAFLLRHLLHPLMQGYAPFHFFILACLCIAFLYGYELAVLAAAVSTLIGAYFFMPPFNTFETPQTVDFIQYLNFWVVTGAAIFVVERLQRAMFTRDLVLKIMVSRQRAALWRENERIHQNRRHQSALQTMLTLVTDFDRALVIGQEGRAWHVTPRWLSLLTERGVNARTRDGTDWRDSLHPDDRQLLTRRLSDPTASGKSPVLPVRLVLPDARVSEPVGLVVEHTELQGQRITLLWLADTA